MTSLSTYYFSTLYTTLPHNLIKEKLLDLIERTFYKKEGKLYLACNDKKAFFTSKDHYKGYQLWSCQNVCDALSFLLDNIYIWFGTKLYRQIVGIPMGTNCAPLVADLFLFCYERDFMKDLSSDNQAGVIKAFNSTSRYLDDLLTLTILILKEWSTKFIHLNRNLIKLILQIPRPPFWIYICLFLTAFFHPKVMINVMTLILI